MKRRVYSWVMVRSDDWKSHAVLENFAIVIINDMDRRGHKGEVQRVPIESFGMDYGGMCNSERPIESFRFFGLKFSVPCEHVESFYKLLLQVKPRVEGGRTYYKFHCYWNCIVLRPFQRRQLLRSLKSKIDKAEAKAAFFYKNQIPLNEVLAAANTAATGINISPEEVGVDKHKRFRNRAGA